MSSPEEDEDEDEDDVFIKLHEEDNKILEELQNVHEDYEKTVEIMQRRRSFIVSIIHTALIPL